MKNNSMTKLEKIEISNGCNTIRTLQYHNISFNKRQLIYQRTVLGNGIELPDKREASSLAEKGKRESLVDVEDPAVIQQTVDFEEKTNCF